MQFQLDIKCSWCNEPHIGITYIPNKIENFVCKKCKKNNILAMTFVCIPDKQIDNVISTMMRDNKMWEKRVC